MTYLFNSNLHNIDKQFINYITSSIDDLGIDFVIEKFCLFVPVQSKIATALIDKLRSQPASLALQQACSVAHFVLYKISPKFCSLERR